MVSSVGIPVNVLIGIPGQMFSLDDLAQAGVRRVSVGSGFERVANAALRRAAEQLFNKRTTWADVLNGLEPLADLVMARAGRLRSGPRPHRR